MIIRPIFPRLGAAPAAPAPVTTPEAPDAAEASARRLEAELEAAAGIRAWLAERAETERQLAEGERAAALHRAAVAIGTLLAELERLRFRPAP